MRREARGAALLLLLTAGGCDFYYDRIPSPDDAMKLVPWFDHMITSPAVHPYESGSVPRTTVPGTVPVHDGEGDWEAAFTGGNLNVADGMVNPLVESAAVIARGTELYDIYCGVCHGLSGDGRGPVGPRVGAPSLLTDRARGLTDGHVYSLVRYGRGVMPRYGDKIVNQADRWAVVSYVRRLQGAGAAAVPGGDD